MTPIYEQVGPWLVEYVMHIPLAIIGFIILWKAGDFSVKKPGGKIVLIMTIWICLVFPIGEAIWHFAFPQMFPLHETIL